MRLGARFGPRLGARRLGAGGFSLQAAAKSATPVAFSFAGSFLFGWGDRTVRPLDLGTSGPLGRLERPGPVHLDGTRTLGLDGTRTLGLDRP